MFIFPSILIAIFGATAALASVINSENPLRHLVTQSSVPRNGNGTHDGFFYYFWSDGQGDITYTNEVISPYHLQSRPLKNLTGRWPILHHLEQHR